MAAAAPSRYHRPTPHAEVHEPASCSIPEILGLDLDDFAPIERELLNLTLEQLHVRSGEYRGVVEGLEARGTF